MAVALVRPIKKHPRVTSPSVKKKMKDKAFARAVNRDDIVRGATELEMPLEDVIADVIAALKADAERLGLAGTPRRESDQQRLGLDGSSRKPGPFSLGTDALTRPRA